MEPNFDLLISGCNTRCRHCYVNGGPGPLMPLDDAIACIEKIDRISSLLPDGASFTLDNEPFNHPDIETIIRAASQEENFFHHGMTTGIALMRRPDRERVIKEFLGLGHDIFGITLHGNAVHHDGIVRRDGAFGAAIEAAEFLRSLGAKLTVSLMFNKYFREDAGEIDETIEHLEPDHIYFSIPNYTPHVNMAGYEPYRATADDLRALSPMLEKWRRDTGDLTFNAKRCTVGSVIRLFEDGASLIELYEREQNEMYLTVHQDCLLYMGNTGVETRCMGDLRELDAEEVANDILRSPGNRDYGAFYRAGDLPDERELIGALKKLPEDLLFCDPESVIYRGLDELGIPTKIL